MRERHRREGDGGRRGERRRRGHEGQAVGLAFEEKARGLPQGRRPLIRGGGIQCARQDLGQAPRALEELGPLVAALPGRQPHAQAREHDDEQGGHDGQRDDHLDEREAPAARARHGVTAAP